MEFGTREILLIIGIVVIVGILLDGVRRVRHTHSGSLKVSVSRRKQGIFDDESIHELPTELPTGEVRVTRRDEQSAEEVSDSIKRYREKNADRQTSVFRQRLDQDTNVVPFQNTAPKNRFTESYDEESGDDLEPPETHVHSDYSHEPDVGFEADNTDELDELPISLSEFDIDDEDNSAPQAEPRQPELLDVKPAPLTASREDDDLPEKDEVFNPEPEDDSRSGRRRPFWEEKNAHRHAEPEKQERKQEKKQEQPRSGRTETQNAKDVIILHVMAKKESTFRGEELLESMLANNFRYGSMRIFHRHENKDGSGPVLFSLANSLKPGTFDLGAMEGFETPGVTIFMPLEGLNHPLEAYKELIRIVQNMAKTLNGAVQDDTRSVLTNQTIEHYRQQIIEFTRRSFTLTN